jgi:4'-phosphopantetheinyl transferase
MALTAIIGADERARADRFRFPRDRRRFVVRRARLRQMLGAWVDRAPEALTFTENSHGKPILVDGPHFSLSHSADMMMLAIGDAEVGCDIERIDPALDWPPLAETFFTTTERAALAALPPEAARRAFFACWARKEAFVKALGLGLSYPLDAFDVSVEAQAELLSGGDGWVMTTGPALAGYATAIVACDDGEPLTVTLPAVQERAAA